MTVVHDGGMPEHRMPGGFVNDVVRVGDTVRRPPPARAAFVHALLDRFERHGWPGAPRFLGVDAQGREILSFLGGQVAWQDRCWRGIEAAAAAGGPAMLRLRDAGAAALVRAALRWVARHRGELEAALTQTTSPKAPARRGPLARARHRARQSAGDGDAESGGKLRLGVG